MSAFSNIRKVRIEWADCDPAGIVFYPRYFEIFDASTSALFERALGMTMLQMFKTYHSAGYPLARTRARFIRPTRCGDDVMVESALTFGRSSFEVAHHITRDGLTCVECSEMRVWVINDPADPFRYKAQPVPDAVLARFRG